MARFKVLPLEEDKLVTDVFLSLIRDRDHTEVCASIYDADRKRVVMTGRLFVIRDGGVMRKPNVSLAFGFPLDDKGRIRLDE